MAQTKDDSQNERRLASRPFEASVGRRTFGEHGESVAFSPCVFATQTPHMGPGSVRRVPSLPTSPSAATGAGQLVLPVRRRWLGWLLAGGLLLGLVSASLQLAKDRGWDPPSLQLDRLLNTDEDQSLLNWLTASTFLLAGMAAYAAAVQQTARRLGWFAVAAVTALVSLDEAAQVHDPVAARAEEQLRAGGVGAALVVLVIVAAGAVVVRFVLGLRWPVRWRVAGAIALVAVAAVGIDAAGPNLVNDPAARLEAGYVARSTVEEFLELSAAVLILDGMLVAALTR